ncbi:dTMP kinase [Lacticaseibacillus pantheris]|uniref:dTMP kinase n=1 Tax=Lacticaseibacillus pantheris TaxID=171523 RepID=UPI00265B1E0C|nr:dTMP kinase [Lacticaseibacillus pantheris]WKF85686.1 dTMP kinase [Lacticaseibacillus pantheris]
MAGVFITFEGPDGAGKDSVLRRVVPELTAHLRVPVLETREPGGARISEHIRELILDPANTEMDPRTEAILYAASRRQHLVEVIRPALAAGKVVVCDRFVDSSIAYQGAGRGIGVDAVGALNNFATEGLTPALTVYLDVPASVGLARINAHRRDTQFDRLDQEKEDFHDRVRAAYLRLAADHRDRIVTVDATQTLDQVCADTLAVLRTHLAAYWQE